MQILRAGFIAILIALSSTLAHAQQNNMYWLNYGGAAPWPPSAWTPVSSGNPFPTTCISGCAGVLNTTATGNITSNQSVSLTPGAGQSSIGIQVTGTWTGTLFVEGSVDGTNYVQTTIVPVLSGSIQTATITANGAFQANVAGMASFRVRGNTVASGTAVVTLISTAGVSTVMADNPFPVTGYTGMTALNIIGNTTIGSATTDKPVMMGGSSTGASGGNAQVAKVDSTGTQFFDCSSGSNTLCGLINSPAIFPLNITPHACSGTITTGGTAQNAFTAQTTLHGFTIKNIDASSGSGEPLWFSPTTTAAASGTDSYPLAAPAATTFANGESFTSPSGMGINTAVSVVAATTGHKFSCTWW